MRKTLKKIGLAGLGVGSVVKSKAKKGKKKKKL